jgi:hypothetical protein
MLVQPAQSNQNIPEVESSALHSYFYLFRLQWQAFLLVLNELEGIRKSWRANGKAQGRAIAKPF